MYGKGTFLLWNACISKVAEETVIQQALSLDATSDLSLAYLSAAENQMRGKTPRNLIISAERQGNTSRVDRAPSRNG